MSKGICRIMLRYNRFSLSRPGLSRITAYLEVKIWSLFKHGNLTRGNKIFRKRGDTAPREQCLLFSIIFSIYLLHQGSNYIFICEMWLFDSLFPQFCKFDISIYGYLKSILESPLDFKTMRVDCICDCFYVLYQR